MEIARTTDWNSFTAVDRYERYRTAPNKAEIATARMVHGAEMTLLAIDGLEKIATRSLEVSDSAPELTPTVRELEYVYVQGAKFIVGNHMMGR